MHRSRASCLADALCSSGETPCRGALCLTQYCCHPLKIVNNVEQGILHLFSADPEHCVAVLCKSKSIIFFSRFLSLWIHSSFQCVATVSFPCARLPCRHLVFLYLWLVSVSGRRILFFVPYKNFSLVTFSFWHFACVEVNICLDPQYFLVSGILLWGFVYGCECRLGKDIV